MPKFAKGLIKGAAVVIIVLAAFSYHWGAGLLAVAVLAAVSFYRNRTVLHSIRANMDYTRGNEDKALAMLERASKSKSVKPRNLINYGYILMKKGEPEEAERVFNEGIVKAVSREDIMLLKINLATAYWLQGKRSETVELLETVYSQYKNTMVYGNLGYFKILHGQLDEALPLNLEAYDYNGDDLTIIDNLAQNYYLLGRMEEAEEMYAKAMTKTPKHSESYYFYAMTLAELGKREEAREQIAKALDREPALIPSVTRDEMERLSRELEKA